MESFGWHLLKSTDVASKEIFDALDEARTVKGKPTMVIAKTVKGKGVSFMENLASWHGSAPNAEQTEKALEELSKND